MTPQQPKLTLAFLGVPRLAVGDNAPTPLADRKLALLLFLLAARGRTDRIQLGACLWPDVEPDRQLASLRLRVHKARQTAPGLLASEGSELELGLTVEHDLDSLRHNRPVPLDTALALADTPLLSGIDVRGLPLLESMVETYRDLLASHAIHAIQREVMVCRDEHRIGQGIALLRRILALAPLNESASRHLMMFYLLNHDRASALQVYERLRTSTRSLLGVEPSAQTSRLRGRILRDDDSLFEEYTGHRDELTAIA